MFARAGFSILAIAGAFALTVGTASTTHAQAQNPMVGSWTFNAAKSTSSTALPKKREVVITEKGADITVTVDEVAADGTAAKWHFTTAGDGKVVPVTGFSAGRYRHPHAHRPHRQDHLLQGRQAGHGEQHRGLC